ncbi:hypothetical protein ACQKWADRAFT_65480 [Trichoderma austrokoningii]
MSGVGNRTGFDLFSCLAPVCFTFFFTVLYLEGKDTTLSGGSSCFVSRTKRVFWKAGFFSVFLGGCTWMYHQCLFVRTDI